jgi:hypothetical protein
LALVEADWLAVKLAGREYGAPPICREPSATAGSRSGDEPGDERRALPLRTVGTYAA